jgi:outer membrane lipoprotein carrier protein
VLVQAFYDGTNDLEAKFKQTYWNPTYNEAKKTSGKLKLKKPGKMVWDYSDGQDADYYSNGSDLWMVEHDTRQVIKTTVGANSEVDAALQFLFGGKALTRDFETRYAKPDRIERYGDADHYVLELKPKAANKHYKGLVLMIHATTGRVDSFVVYNTDESSNYFQLKSIKTNVGLSDKLFDFELPSGYVESVE